MATESKQHDDKCPRCGATMCQKFDERSGPNGITLAIPNGQYSCMKCGYEPEEIR